MQGYQQYWIVFGLCITATYAKFQINDFGPNIDTGVAGSQTTIFADHIELWAYVTDCLEPACKCEVKTSGLEEKKAVTFVDKDKPGHVKITNLQPDTTYSFTLSCNNAGHILTSTNDFKTDYGRPSAPQNISVVLVSQKLSITWSPPLKPAGPIQNYQIKIDNKLIVELPNNSTSFSAPEVYNEGAEHTIIVTACNKDKREETVCSPADEGKYTLVPVTLAPTTSPPTSTTSAGIHSYSISISIIIFSLFFFSQM